MSWEAGCQCIMQNRLENRVYAGFWVRLIAFAIDSFIAACVVSTIKSPFAMASAAGIELFDANFLFHYSFLDVLDYIAVAAYFVLLTYFTHTTLGKMVMGLEVITTDEEWTLLNVIYRETIGRFFSSLMCVGYFAVIVSARKQGFHDMFCNTYVVYKNMVRKMEPIAEASVASVPVTPEVFADSIEEGNVENKTEVESSMNLNIQEDKPEVVAPVYYTMPAEQVAEEPELPL